MGNRINHQESIQEDVGIGEGLRSRPGFSYCIFFHNFEDIFELSFCLFCVLLCGSLDRHTDS